MASRVARSGWCWPIPCGRGRSSPRQAIPASPMLVSIVSYGLALGAVYALIGITYNVMFAASRVFSFTAGITGMLGGVLGALFIDRLGMPVIVGFVATLAAGAVLGIITEILTVRPVMKSLGIHIYVLVTNGLALLVLHVRV